MLRPEAGALTPDDEDDDESSVPNYGPHTKPKDCSHELHQQCGRRLSKSQQHCSSFT